MIQTQAVCPESDLNHCFTLSLNFDISINIHFMPSGTKLEKCVGPNDVNVFPFNPKVT